MLLKYFLFATLSVVNSFAAFFFFSFFQADVAVERESKFPEKKIEAFFLYLRIDLLAARNPLFWQRREVRKRLLIGALEAFDPVEYWSQIWGASELNQRRRPGLTRSYWQR